MNENIRRGEFEDIVRHLTVKVDRLQEQVAAATEECAWLCHSLVVADYQIRQLTRWLFPLLSVEEQELFGVDRRAAVIDGDILERPSIEPNDGNEWRERLRARGLAAALKTPTPATQTR